MNEAQIVWGLTGLLFLTGAAGLVLRRQLLAMLLCMELMTNAVNVALAYYARRTGDAAALSAVFVLLAVAAAEAVVGLSLILAVHRQHAPADSGVLKELQG